MNSNARDGSWQAQGSRQEELLLGPMDNDAKEPSATSPPRTSMDKVRCLDGLRGIACLLVFNYHFIWPWTPVTMLGYGAMPPYAPEPYGRLASLPIICLLHRGRPMVSIFFALSGYVVCRHVLKAIRERRLNAAYRGLASAAFRRAFRLYIPPTLTMFLVAVLAQMGAFKSEFAIYSGPDSVHINGTVFSARWDQSCPNGTFAATGAADAAHYMGLQSPLYLGNITAHGADLLCVDTTSQLLGPLGLYPLVAEYEAEMSDRAGALNETGRKGGDTFNTTEPLDYKWVHFGGSWEEHPIIHDNLTHAVKSFTRAFAEWANPFQFRVDYPRYDPHTFTIPIEFRGSMVVYLFLLATAAIRDKWRLRFATCLSAYGLLIGRWDMATFLGGMMLSEIEIWRSSGTGTGAGSQVLPLVRTGPAEDRPGDQPGGSSHRDTAMRSLAAFVALWFLSYPDIAAEYTPGFRVLSQFVPRYYSPNRGWMFYQAMGALLLLPCVLRSAVAKELLEGPVPQYLGKISFSFYLVHGPVLHSLGFWIMPRLFEGIGWYAGLVVGWAVLMSTSLYLAHWWHKKIDIWSASIGKKMEKLLAE